MNKNKLKSYAPAARRDFIQAVTERAHMLGLSAKEIKPAETKGDFTIIEGKPFPREVGRIRKKLVELINRNGFGQVMEKLAYTWFNRFAALRYMELHDFLGHGFRVLSNPSGSVIPEILERAVDVDLPGLNKNKVTELKLAGDKDVELYRLLVIAQCNALHQAMPIIFEAMEDETELLLPDNLLHTNSPVQKMVQEIDEVDWQEIEIIGWLYQFYISEKKDQVIGKVVKSEDIPAATQLFTPNWIVKYMVQNTLGRQWLATYPDSSLRGKMDFYIEPAEQTDEVLQQLKEITPTALNPEEITLMDPACGSGHILVEAYDLLKEIYLERGYRRRDIPRLILEKNLYGLDIDDRAMQLSRFALFMKAREDDRRIFGDEAREIKTAQPNVYAIPSTAGLDYELIAKALTEEKHKSLIPNRETLKPTQESFLPKPEQPLLGSNEQTTITHDEITELLRLFENGLTFGSLIRIPQDIANKIIEIESLAKACEGGTWIEQQAAANISNVILVAGLLVGQFDNVITNPPYMGSGGMNGKLKLFAKDNYPNSKFDLFSMFVERNLAFSREQGMVAMITMQSWMFLSSFEHLRSALIDSTTLLSMAHLGSRAFDSIGGEVVSTTSFVLQRKNYSNYYGSYVRLVDGNSEAEKIRALQEAIYNKDCGWFYRASAADFNKIPGSPIAYWASAEQIKLFDGPKISQFGKVGVGLQTGNNDKFVRFWFEVSSNDIYSTGTSKTSPAIWYPCNKGGAYRKWYGNFLEVILWKDNGAEIKANRPSAVIRNESCYFTPCVTWSRITTTSLSFRYVTEGFIHNDASCFVVGNNNEINMSLLAFLNSPLKKPIIEYINPTINLLPGQVNNTPYLIGKNVKVDNLIGIAKIDWDSCEISWDFMGLPLLHFEDRRTTLEATYTELRIRWHKMSIAMQRMEEINNHNLIEQFGMQGELRHEVPLTEITLNCNPEYRYGPGKTNEEYDSLLLSDTMKELISYSIGCMMGRYSLDQEGLIYAHSSNQGFDPTNYKTLPADDDGIIPVIDQDWFEDNATNRFVEFLKVAWSAETLNENLKFVADALGSKRGEMPVETIRRYISTGFFRDHLQTYKNRPIYWLFSSGKERAFQCLVYLHRYNESTLARMRSAYVTPLQGKINSRIDFYKREVDAATTAGERNKHQKELDKLSKKRKELAEYDELLRHYADQRISLDLDDGVKVNYGKFGTLLADVKKVTGKTPV